MSSDDSTKQLSVIEEQAFQLSQAAIMLDQARGDDGLPKEGFAAALQNNLDVWMAISTIAQRAVPGFSTDVRNNLVKLAHFVADTTFAEPEQIGKSTIDTLININLQVAEGLLEAKQNS